MFHAAGKSKEELGAMGAAVPGKPARKFPRACPGSGRTGCRVLSFLFGVMTSLSRVAVTLNEQASVGARGKALLPGFGE